MRKFKEGDRVRFTGNPRLLSSDGVTIGTVQKEDPVLKIGLPVLFDGLTDIRYCWENDLELIP